MSSEEQKNEPRRENISLEEATKIMNNRVLLPQKTFGIDEGAPPVFISRAELEERARDGYDLVFMEPMTIEGQNNKFIERHGKTKGKLFMSPPLNEPFVNAEVTHETGRGFRGWVFQRAFVKGSEKLNYLEQVVREAEKASRERFRALGFDGAYSLFKSRINILADLLNGNADEQPLFLKELAKTKIEYYIIPSAAEQSYHIALLKGESKKTPFGTKNARNRSRSDEQPGIGVSLGLDDEEGLIVYRRNPDRVHSKMGLASVRRIT